MKDKEDYVQLEPSWFQTERHDSAAEAWKELGEYLQAHIKELHWIGFRAKPEVRSEYLYDYKKTIYMGFVRFFTQPEPFLKDSNTFNIPSIGSI